MSCPMCGGPQDRINKIEASGVWNCEGEGLSLRQIQLIVLRCVDCGHDEEIDGGRENMFAYGDSGQG